MAEPIKNALKFAAAVFVIATGLGLLGIGAFATATGVAWTAVVNTAVYAFVGTAAAGIIGQMNSKGIEASADNLGAKTTVRNPLKFRQIIYGKTKVAGAVTHMETSGNDNHRLKFVVVFSGHPVTSIESVFFNDTKLTTTTSTINGETVFTVTNSKYVNTENEQSFGSGRLARFTTELGDQTTVNGYANAQMASITNNSIFKDCCYIMFDLVYDAEKFGGGIPNVTAVIKGKKVYDPRESDHDETDSSTWEWSDNPALIWRDYLSDTTFGLRATADELNDTTSNGGVQAAANRCDEDVTLADGSTTQSRYTANGFFNMGSDGQGVLSAILSSCAGKMSYTNGKFNIFAGGTQTPSLTITDADIINPISVVTNPKNADLYNTVKAIYTDSTGDKYQGTDSAIYQDSTYLTNDTPSGETSANFVKMQEIQLPLTVSDSRAQRIARISLNHQRQTTIVQCVTTLSYMRLQPNDWVYLTNSRLGFSSKVFEVVGQQLELIKQGDVAVLGTALTLKEIENSVFSFGVSDYVANISDGTDQGGGDLSLGVPTGLSASTQQAVDGATSKYDILVSWTNRASSRVIGTEVAYKLSVASEYSSLQVGKGISQATIPNVVKGQQYNLKVRHFDQSAIYSSYTAVVNHTISDTTAVSAPTNFTVTGNPVSILLSWTNPNNANLRAIKLYRHTSSWTPTDDTYLISSIAGEPNKNMVMRFGAGDGLTAGTTYYFSIRAILHTDVHSDFTSVESGSFTLDRTTVNLSNVEDKSSADIRGEIVEADLVGSGNAFSVKPNKTNFADGSTEGAFTFQLDDGSATGVNVFSSAERTKLDRLRLGQDPADATRSIQNNDISINPSGQLAGIGTGNNSIVNNANIVASDIEGSGKAFPANSVTKLGGIEANATVGATAGTDLKDSSDNTLSDEDVRNDDLSLAYSGTNIQIKKGTTQIGSNVDAPNALKNAQVTLDKDVDGNLSLNNAGSGSVSFDSGDVGLGNVANKRQVDVDLSNAPDAIKNAEITSTDVVGPSGKLFTSLPASGATVGAQVGTNLTDSGGTGLDDEDVRNDDLSLAYSGTNIQIKKGTTQIGSNVDAPNALKNAEIQDSDIVGSGKVFAANQKPNKTTFADNSTEGVFTLGVDGTDSTVNVFSSAERTKLDRLRQGQNPANASESILNSAITANDIEGTGKAFPADSVSKLGGIEAGATVGATLGAQDDGNIVDSNGNDLTEDDLITNNGTANDTDNVNNQTSSNVTGAITGAQSNIAGVITDLQTGDQQINGDCIATGTLSANLLDVQNLKLQTAGTGSSGTTIVSGSSMDNDLVASIGTGAGYYMGSISYDLISGSTVLGASIHLDIYAGASLVYTKYFPIGIKEGNQYYDAGDAFGHSGDLAVMHMEFGFFYTGTSTLNVYLGADSNGTSSSAVVKMRAVKFGAEVPSFDTSAFTASRTGITAGANSDSGEVDVSGFTGSKSVTLSGHSSAKVSVDNGTFQSAGSEDSIDSGMPFEIRLTASSTAGVTRTATVTIEGVSVTYSVTTAGTYSPSYGGGGFESELELR